MHLQIQITKMYALSEDRKTSYNKFLTQILHRSKQPMTVEVSLRATVYPAIKLLCLNS